MVSKLGVSKMLRHFFLLFFLYFFSIYQVFALTFTTKKEFPQTANVKNILAQVMKLEKIIPIVVGSSAPHLDLNNVTLTTLDTNFTTIEVDRIIERGGNKTAAILKLKGTNLRKKFEKDADRLKRFGLITDERLDSCCYKFQTKWDACCLAFQRCCFSCLDQTTEILADLIDVQAKLMIGKADCEIPYDKEGYEISFVFSRYAGLLVVDIIRELKFKFCHLIKVPTQGTPYSSLEIGVNIEEGPGWSTLTQFAQNIYELYVDNMTQTFLQVFQQYMVEKLASSVIETLVQNGLEQLISSEKNNDVLKLNAFKTASSVDSIFLERAIKKIENVERDLGSIIRLSQLKPGFFSKELIEESTTFLKSISDHTGAMKVAIQDFNREAQKRLVIQSNKKEQKEEIEPFFVMSSGFQQPVNNVNKKYEDNEIKKQKLLEQSLQKKRVQVTGDNYIIIENNEEKSE